MMRKLLPLLGLAQIFASHNGFGRELDWTHYGLRPLGMGNAYVAVADDFNALFYNPAGLARLSDWHGELINPFVEVSANTKDFATEMMGMSSNDNAEMLAALEKQTGRTQHVALGLTPHLVFPGFGFGLGFRLGGTMAIHRDISTDVNLGGRVIMPIVYAKNFFEERLSLGMGVKGIFQTGVDRNFNIGDLQAFSNKDNDADKPKLGDYVEGGYGMGVDTGLLFTPVKLMEPTLGVSITDLGGTPFKQTTLGSEPVSPPKARRPSVNTGMSLKPYQSGKMYILTSVDTHAINQPEHFSKKFNLGAEWGFGQLIKIQTGLHQGEFSGGVQLDAWLLVVRAVTYAEQLGSTAGQGEYLSDRRYALQLKLLL